MYDLIQIGRIFEQNSNSQNQKVGRYLLFNWIQSGFSLSVQMTLELSIFLSKFHSSRHQNRQRCQSHLQHSDSESDEQTLENLQKVNDGLVCIETPMNWWDHQGCHCKKSQTHTTYSLPNPSSILTNYLVGICPLSHYISAFISWEASNTFQAALWKLRLNLGCSCQSTQKVHDIRHIAEQKILPKNKC